MSVPTWICKDFLSTVLQKDHAVRVEVLGFSAESAVPPGNNYLSTIYRVGVEYKFDNSEPVHTSLIVKIPMDTGSGKDGEEDIDFFAKEPKVYNELLPAMLKKTKIEFGPKSYSCPIKNGLVLQDLREKNYLMCNRFQQLDYDHCKEVFITLAKFHATSVACLYDNPKFMEAFGEGPQLDESEPMTLSMKAGVENGAMKVAELTKSMEECKGFSELVVSRHGKLWESFKTFFDLRIGNFNVIVHGDLWTNNVLFKYNEKKKVEKVKFIDYQLTRYASPATDIIYFIWNSGNSDVRENRLGDLNCIYIQTLNNTLEDLGCNERYSLEELNQDLKKTTDIVLSLICQHLPLLLADPDDGAFTLHDLHPVNLETGKPNEVFEKLYTGKYYRNILPAIARHYLFWISS